jgi:L-seryl-tRNA(Ser) seleniumtransferase
MAAASSEELERRARALAAALNEAVPGLKAEAIASAAVTGGGSLPGGQVSSWAVAVVHPEKSAAAIERALRAGETPVIGRIEDDVLLLDLRTVFDEDDERLLGFVVAALA